MNSKIKSMVETSSEVRDFELRDVDELGVLVKVQNSDALFENLNSIITSESSVTYFVDGSEELKGIEADIEEFMDRLASDTGDFVETKVNVNDRIVTVSWNLKLL